MTRISCTGLLKPVLTAASLALFSQISIADSSKGCSSQYGGDEVACQRADDGGGGGKGSSSGRK